MILIYYQNEDPKILLELLDLVFDKLVKLLWYTNMLHKFWFQGDFLRFLL